ncbi:MAG: alpha/beta fold hydrolase [Candidatus Hydrogenedens sp.]|nr:alpha/beta fold hydrolase [Candidatus Hydrogenedens sp.]
MLPRMKSLLHLLRRRGQRLALLGLVVAGVWLVWTLLLVQAGKSEALEAPPNLALPTLGGKQLWADERLYGGWRIQRNVYTGHCRLLDAGDVRRAWGGEDQCGRVLDAAIESGAARLKSRKLCVLVHGFLRSKDSFKTLQGRLEAAGYTVYAVNYPSMHGTIAELAEPLKGILEEAANDFDSVDLVTHSLGGLIVRELLSESERTFPGRIVMLAPPNQGTRMADALLSWWPSEYVAGPAGTELVTGDTGAGHRLPAPRCEFGVIAGSLAGGLNPIIPGDDDGLVGVDEAKLDGMADYRMVKAAHTFIMNHDEAIRQVLHFLAHGRFEHPEGGEEF